MTTSPLTPSPNDVPFNEPQTVQLASNQQATVSFVPQQRNTTFVLPQVAVSKVANTTYAVRIDDETVYGPAGVPPTDIDDSGQTFYPARRFSKKLEILITNVGSSTQTYHVQPVGWELGGGTNGA